MSKGSTFNTIIIVVSIVAAVVAVLIFGGVIPLGSSSSSQSIKGQVILWGTWPTTALSTVLDNYNSAGDLKIVYVPRNPDTFDRDLVEAIARGEGPDLVFIPQDSIYRDQDKLYHIPFTSLPEQTFRSTYTQEAGLLVYPDGIVGLPFVIDPMIMYYNRNLFEQAGITEAPKTWDALTTIVPDLTRKDARGTLLASAIPFGNYGNSTHAKDIIALLLLQAGNPIIYQNQSTLLNTLNLPVAPAISVLQFFTQFADPLKSTYTWNSAFPQSREAFLSEDLAIYLGYASELPTLVDKNPNLNFDIARVPQVSGVKTQLTYGKMTTLAMVKSTRNTTASFKVLTDLTSPAMMSAIVANLSNSGPLAPARLDLLGTKPTVLWGPLVYNSAIIARSWTDPSVVATEQIFHEMVDQVLVGSDAIGSIVATANNRLGLLLK